MHVHMSMCLLFSLTYTEGWVHLFLMIFALIQLSDFGLAITSGTQNKNNLKLSGTVGYVAPEYLLDGITKLFLLIHGTSIEFFLFHYFFYSYQKITSIK